MAEIDRWLSITLRGYQFDQQFENDFSYQYQGSDPRPTDTDLVAVGNAFWAFVATSQRGIIGGLSYFSTVKVEDHSPTNRVQGIYTIPSPSGGTLAGDSLPFNVSEVIGFKTGEIYRGGHGRAYTPASTELVTNNGLYTAAYIVLIAVAAANLAGFHFGGPLAMQHVVARQTPGYLRAVRSYTFDYIPDSQRRRLQGRGR